MVGKQYSGFPYVLKVLACSQGYQYLFLLGMDSQLLITTAFFEEVKPYKTVEPRWTYYSLLYLDS
jgi:hypothetical protein